MKKNLLWAAACLTVPWQVFAMPSSAWEATTQQIASARKIVDDAIQHMTVLNKARLDHPARNHYSLKLGTVVNKRRGESDAPPPLLNITAEIASSAALLAKIEAAGQSHPVVSVSVPVTPRSAQANRFWMEDIQRKGTVPWVDDPNYKVFRNIVTDYGADNTGKKDATAAIQRAIDDGKRCGEKCNGSSTKNAIVNFPAGTYLVSSTIKVYFGTQIIGDANNLPTIKAPSSFVGLGVLSTDMYVTNGGTGPDGMSLEWYINTARFYSQIRNLRIDITGEKLVSRLPPSLSPLKDELIELVLAKIK